MSAAPEDVACLVGKSKVTELQAALLQNQKQLRNYQQQARREAASLRKGGLSGNSVRKVLAVYALSQWNVTLALRAAQTLQNAPTFGSACNKRLCEDSLSGAYQQALCCKLRVYAQVN